MRKFLKKFQVKGFVVGFLFCVALSTALVWANTGGTWREVFYGVNVVVNGVPQNFPSDMTPFIAGGRTFLPVRGIADVLNFDSSYIYVLYIEEDETWADL